MSSSHLRHTLGELILALDITIESGEMSCHPVLAGPLMRARNLLADPESTGTRPSEEELDHMWRFGFSRTPKQRCIDIALEALDRWGSLEPAPIALTEKSPTAEANDLNSEGVCWWWDSVDERWEPLAGDSGGVASIIAYNNNPNSSHTYTHWLPHGAIPVPDSDHRKPPTLNPRES